MFNKKMLEKHISINPSIQHGRPCIKGTRTPVYVILEALATGMDSRAIQEEFTGITAEDIQACILYGAVLADEQEIISQPI